MSLTDYRYPIDGWKIREIHFDPAMAGRNETIFALANGHLGMRGNFEEGFCNVTNGTYLNGFFEESEIIYGETAYGYAKNRQVMLNVADAKVIRLTVDGEPFDLSTGNIIAYQRTLDLREGVLTREVRWVSPSGKTIEVKTARMVSLTRPHIAAIDYRIVSKGGKISVDIESAINGNVLNQTGRGDPRIGTRLDGRVLTTTNCEASEARGLITQRTRNTGMVLSCAMDHLVSAEVRGDQRPVVESLCEEGGDEAIVRVHCELERGESLAIEKLIGYCSSREFAVDELEGAVKERVSEARAAGFDGLKAEQESYLERFWAISDIEVGGDEPIQQGLRYNLFSLLQSTGRDGRTSIAAKGLTGEGYEGHYFWDTEIYVLPFFIYSDPEIARSLLRYRCGILDKARERAAEMSQEGALFPWRTIGGEETSPYYPAGSAQYHINADIAFALRKYLNANFDRKLLLERAAEVLFETARLWADLGDWLPPREAQGSDPAGGRPDSDGEMFYINEVTGPDEYTALVNNNCYTNLMAQFNLQTAVETAEYLKEHEPRELKRISERLSLREDEVENWRRAAASMFVPYDRRRGIYAQDDAFLNRAVWDFAGTPTDRYPLLLHFHPLVIYRYQVLKQPDVVLAQVLRGDRFTMAEKKRNFDYYDPLTTGDSSLSPCIQSVAAAELGYTEQAYRYFMRTARMDLDDVNRNVADGVHTAAMAGTWISLVYGFMGMRDYAGRLSFDPRLPREWRNLRLKLRFNGKLLAVRINHDTVTYELEPLPTGPSGDSGEGKDTTATPGETLTITHRNRELSLTYGKPWIATLHPVLSCVVFDLDGVITDTAEYHYQAWSRIAEEVGAPIDRSFNERLKGVSRLESLELILANGGKELSQQEKMEVADRKNGYYRELIAGITPDDLLPGIAELLNQLRSHGIKTAVASVSHNVWEVVKRLQIGDRIDLIVDPSSVVKGKPDPEIFMAAAEELKVHPTDCVGIEDAQAGIDAIKSARMFAVGIGKHLTGTDWNLPDTTGLTYEELLRQFDRFASSYR